MDYDKSYFNKYEDNDLDINNIYSNKFDIIIEKTNNNIYQFQNNKMIILQNKVEELLLKLKYINFNKKNSNIDILDILNDSQNIDTNSNYVINIIDKIILKLNKKIITKGQIKRKNNLLDFEF
jgi:hypothetical protein